MNEIVMSIVGDVEGCGVRSKCRLYSMGDVSIVDTPETTEHQNSQRPVLCVHIPNGFHCITCDYSVLVENGKIFRLKE